MSEDMEALANAWEAGWTAASDRAQRVLLMAASMGVQRTLKTMQNEAPVPNPYRIKGGAS